jgi:hypothetical protein
MKFQDLDNMIANLTVYQKAQLIPIINKKWNH